MPEMSRYPWIFHANTSAAPVSGGPDLKPEAQRLGGIPAGKPPGTVQHADAGQIGGKAVRCGKAGRLGATGSFASHCQPAKSAAARPPGTSVQKAVGPCLQSGGALLPPWTVPPQPLDFSRSCCKACISCAVSCA